MAWVASETYGKIFRFIVAVKERYNDGQCVVEGLSPDELRQIIASPESEPESHHVPGEKYRRVEFTTQSYLLLNALEQLGYKYVFVK